MRRIWPRLTLLLCSLLAVPAAVLAQPPADPAAPAPGGEPAARLALSFKGLRAGQALRLGPSGSPLTELSVADDGTAQAEVEAGRIYVAEWGDPGDLHPLRFYVPVPEDRLATGLAAAIELGEGLRRVPDQTWEYAWAPGENQKLAAMAPPPAPPRRRPQPARAEPAALRPEDAAKIADLEARVAALSAASNSPRPAEQPASPGPALWLAVAALALAAGMGIGALAFYYAAWDPHRRAVTHELERSLPDALRAQSQEVAGLTRRLDAVGQQWQRDVEALRRGQELLASHQARPGAAGVDPAELARLRAEVERLREAVGQGRGS